MRHCLEALHLLRFELSIQSQSWSMLSCSQTVHVLHPLILYCPLGVSHGRPGHAINQSVQRQALCLVELSMSTKGLSSTSSPVHCKNTCIC